ncbi:MAG: hypothetical protein FJ211_07050 [Ignavibacteria bacterium]|nr:hypothetical protein [Ignavibacteria bacterium]
MRMPTISSKVNGTRHVQSCGKDHNVILHTTILEILMFNVILVTLVLSCSLLNAGVWPAGGALYQPLQVGSAVEITWDRALSADHVDIQMWDGDKRMFHPIASGVSVGRTAYTWVIPQSITPGKLYRFVVRDAANPHRAEFSTGFHEILSAGSVATTVDPEYPETELLIVSPLPADDRARIAWKDYDALSIDVIDIQGTVRQTLVPPPSTRACVLLTHALNSGQYSIMLRRADGRIITKTLMVSH